MNAARHARKLKHIEKVKAAIRFQQATRKRQEAAKERKGDTKTYRQQGDIYRKALNELNRNAANNAKQDWNLGQLRPNRAIGPDANTYGVLPLDAYGYGVRLPKHWFGSESKVESRLKKHIPENVRLDRWPIVEGDRVVVIRGVHVNKIGTVKDLEKERYVLSVEGINQVGAYAVHTQRTWLTFLRYGRTPIRVSRAWTTRTPELKIK